MVNERCTTCHYFQIPYPKRFCGHPHRHQEIKDPHLRCPLYINMLDKDRQNRQVKKSIYETQQVINAELFNQH